METTVKVVAKAGSGKAFKASDDSWYNISEDIIPVLATVNKGDEITITFEKKGTANYVSRIVPKGAVSAPAIVPTVASTGYTCEVCGKALKDGKYKKCFTCNKFAPKKDANPNPPQTIGSGTVTTQSTTPPVTWQPRSGSSYGSPEDVAGKEVGCAINAAAAILSGRQEQPEVLLEMHKLLAQGILDFMRALK